MANLKTIVNLWDFKLVFDDAASRFVKRGALGMLCIFVSGDLVGIIPPESTLYTDFIQTREAAPTPNKILGVFFDKKTNLWKGSETK